MIDRNSNAEDLNQHAEPGSPEYEKALRAINFLDGIRDADRSGDRETAHLNPEVTVGGDILHTKIKLDHIGHYEILERIGRGGFSTVFLGLDRRLNREVAIKVLSAAATFSEEACTRFEIEARAAAVLQHPAIVPIFDCDCAGDVKYIAYEYCPGETLQQWREGHQQPIDPFVAARIVAKLAEAIQHAHHRGIVHRDLKPANIMIDTNMAAPGSCPSEKVRVTDFGLARQTYSSSDSPTIDGSVIGTPTYMSPEQARGDNKIAHTTDIYSLGTILYELLTSELPFRRGSAVATMRAVETEPVPDMRRSNPAIPRDLEAICLKCLAKAPADRYQTAHALQQDLAAWQSGRPITARPVTTTTKLKLWFKRNPGLAASIALFTILILSALAVTTSLWRTSQANVVVAESQNQRANKHIASLDSTINFVLDEYSSVLQEDKQLDDSQTAILKKMLTTQTELLNQEIGSLEVSLAAIEKYRKVGGIYRLLGESDDSMRFLDTGVELIGQAKTTHPEYSELQVEKYSLLFELFMTENQFGNRQDTIDRIVAAKDFFDISKHHFEPKRRLQTEHSLYRHIGLAYQMNRQPADAMIWVGKMQIVSDQMEETYGAENWLVPRLNENVLAGNIFRALNQREKALRSFNEGIRILEETPDSKKQAAGLLSIGSILHREAGLAHYPKSEVKQAIYHFERAIHLTKLLNDASPGARDGSGLLYTMNRLLNSFRVANDLPKGHALAKECVAFGRKVPRSPLQAKSLVNSLYYLGYFQLNHLEDEKAAEACFREAIGLAESNIRELADVQAHYHSLVKPQFALADLLLKSEDLDATSRKEATDLATSLLENVTTIYNSDWGTPPRAVSKGAASILSEKYRESGQVDRLCNVWNQLVKLEPKNKFFRLSAAKEITASGVLLAKQESTTDAQINRLIDAACKHLEQLQQNDALLKRDLESVSHWDLLKNSPRFQNLLDR